MSVSYDVFTDAFLDKITEYDFLKLGSFDRTKIVDGYMKRACSRFNKICKYDLLDRDDENRVINTDIPEDKLDSIVDIVTEGMLEQWMRPYVYKQENLENALNTKDYTGYSPAELLHRIVEAYGVVKRDFRNLMNNYSYDNGDLTDLSL